MNNKNIAAGTQRKLVTVNQIDQDPNIPFTKSAMRHLIFESEPRVASTGDTVPGNGMKEAGVIIRLGRKVLIDLEKFLEWIDSHREK